MGQNFDVFSKFYLNIYRHKKSPHLIATKSEILGGIVLKIL